MNKFEPLFNHRCLAAGREKYILNALREDLSNLVERLISAMHSDNEALKATKALEPGAEEAFKTFIQRQNKLYERYSGKEQLKKEQNIIKEQTTQAWKTNPRRTLSSSDYGALSADVKKEANEASSQQETLLFLQSITNREIDDIWGFKKTIIQTLEILFKGNLTDEKLEAFEQELEVKKSAYIDTHQPINTADTQEKRVACTDEMMRTCIDRVSELIQMKKAARVLPAGLDEIQKCFQKTADSVVFYQKTKTPTGSVVLSPENIMTAIQNVNEAALIAYRFKAARNHPLDSFDITHASWLSALDKTKDTEEPIVLLFFKIGVSFRETLMQPESKKNIDTFKKEVQKAKDECISKYKKIGQSTLRDYIKATVLVLVGLLVGLLTSPGLVFESHRSWMKNRFFSGLETKQSRALQESDLELSNILLP